MTTDDDILIAISPSPMRRWLALFCLVALGLLLIFTVSRGTSSIGWQAIFLASAFGILWGAKKMYAATQDTLELTRTELRTRNGVVLTTIDNVNKVERGPFAFKPSNGFLVNLNEPLDKIWAPGLYWRRGKMLGIGGVISGGESRAMAEMIGALKIDLSEFEELFPHKK